MSLMTFCFSILVEIGKIKSLRLSNIHYTSDSLEADMVYKLDNKKYRISLTPIKEK